VALKFNYHGPLALALPVAGEGVSYLDLFAKAYSLRLKRRNPFFIQTLYFFIKSDFG